MLLDKENSQLIQDQNIIIDGIKWVNNIQKENKRLFDLAIKQYKKFYTNHIDENTIQINFNFIYEKMENSDFSKLTKEEINFLKNLYEIAYNIFNRAFYVTQLSLIPFKTRVKKIIKN
jgi:hypothetical protein